LKDSKLLSGQLKVLGDEVKGFSYFLMDLTSESNTPILYQWSRKGKIKASIKLIFQSDGIAVSLPKLPFGGFWISGSIHSEELEAFICDILEHLKSLDCVRLEITQAPKPYEMYSELIGNILYKVGFDVLTIQSHQLFLGKKKIRKELDTLQFKKKILARNKGISFYRGQIKNFGFLQEIRNWNSQKGYAILFDDDKLINQVSLFPARYFQISIFDQNEPIAHALAVKLVPESLYYYLSASSPRPNLSIVGELIMQNLFELAVEQKSDFIDLGTSEIDSELNHPLNFFKSRFSNDLSNKVTWQYKF
jgi:hypothetical protein